MDCYSPGQGLMPASFKVRTVPFDGSNEGFQEVLDPDFADSAIGSIASIVILVSLRWSPLHFVQQFNDMQLNDMMPSRRLLIIIIFYFKRILVDYFADNLWKDHRRLCITRENDVQTGIKLILNLCLSGGFDMFPSSH